ncbi:MAG: UvrB/UvrC motif-containing protein, partial [Phycisphaerales bacterium]
DTFDEQLTPLLARAHEGGAHHTGKTPGRAGLSAGLHRELSSLRRELEDAIKAEEYERAASLRDRIRTLHGETEREAPKAASKNPAEPGGKRAKRTPRKDDQ